MGSEHVFVHKQAVWRCYVQYKMQITKHTCTSQLALPDALRLRPSGAWKLAE